MAKHHSVVRRKGKCSCGMKKRSKRDLLNHIAAMKKKNIEGYELVEYPSKSS